MPTNNTTYNKYLPGLLFKKGRCVRMTKRISISIAPIQESRLKMFRVSAKELKQKAKGEQIWRFVPAKNPAGRSRV